MNAAIKDPMRFALTKRELQITRLIVNEYSTKEIAQELFLSIETIKTHRKNILHKMCVKNVAGIVREAMHQKILLLNTA